ncbi:PhoH family protein [Kordiimonas pumila]|uniref:PhoH-like protein n=1 Tax=Kordiimonas pumila TaxID=2161677 RepID=A0ABV7CZY5_9PROT|nr:PhoH family protein [Kordiimonas pumila]
MYAKRSAPTAYGQPDTGKSNNHRRLVVEFEDNRLAAIVFGQHDQNLSRIEQLLGVVLINRGNRVAIEGPAERSDLAKRVLTDLYEHARRGHEVSIGAVDGAVRMSEGTTLANDGKAEPRTATTDSTGAPGLKITTRNRIVMPRTQGQADYMSKLLSNEMVFGVGPAGTGKTYLAVAMAVARMLGGEVDRIVLSRPAVEAGENLGFLPGDLKDKVDPYLRPLYDALYDMMPAEQVEKRMASGQIEIAPLAYMRGRTLSNAFVILDEAQNTTPMQMKMFLTRFGENSRMAICGDPSQVDLQRGTRSGLRHALDILRGVEGIAVTRFNQTDVVRHPLVGRIVDAYGDEDGR